jgi:hypothetical protein
MKKGLLFFGIAIIIFVLLASRANKVDCDPQEVNDTFDKFTTSYQSFIDRYEASTYGDPGTLDKFIEGLKSDLRMINDTKSPVCMWKLRTSLSKVLLPLLDAVIFRNAGETGSTIQRYIDESNSHVDELNLEYQRIKTCKPNCQ